MKTSKAPKKAVKVTPRELPETFYRIKTLLHTIRSIAQHEDRLCTLLHSVEQAGAVEPDVLHDLKTLLEELPAYEYADELVAVQNALPAHQPKPGKKVSKKIVKRTPAKA